VIAGQMPAVTARTALAAGYVGQYAEVNSTGSISVPTGEWSDGACPSYTPAAGIWDVQTHAVFECAATTKVKTLGVGLGTATGNANTGMNFTRGFISQAWDDAVGLVLNTNVRISSPIIRVPASGSQAYYAKSTANFSTSTMNIANYMTWRRIA
jgi:phage baseplate assembly protein gpV